VPSGKNRSVLRFICVRQKFIALPELGYARVPAETNTGVAFADCLAAALSIEKRPGVSAGENAKQAESPYRAASSYFNQGDS